MFEIISKIFGAFGNNSTKPAPEKEQLPDRLQQLKVVEPPPVPVQPFETRIQAAIIRAASNYSNLRETHGKNRSPEIDKINLRQKSYLGAPWCLALVQQVLDDVRAGFGCTIDLPEGVGTQYWWRSVRDKYKEMKPEPGMIGIMQSKKDPRHGHAFIVVGQMSADGWFQTFEGNTDLSGDRDGDGAFFSKRHIQSKESRGLVLLGFVDVAKAATPT